MLNVESPILTYNLMFILLSCDDWRLLNRIWRLDLGGIPAGWFFFKIAKLNFRAAFFRHRFCIDFYRFGSEYRPRET